MDTVREAELKEREERKDNLLKNRARIERERLAKKEKEKEKEKAKRKAQDFENKTFRSFYLRNYGQFNWVLVEVITRDGMVISEKEVCDPELYDFTEIKLLKAALAWAKDGKYKQEIVNEK